MLRNRIDRLVAVGHRVVHGGSRHRPPQRVTPILLETLDGFVFTAGIGEHAMEIREAVCARLGRLGVGLDAGANRRGDTRISAQESRVAVWVIPTDEEAMIARHTRHTIRAGRKSGAKRGRAPAAAQNGDGWRGPDRK